MNLEVLKWLAEAPFADDMYLMVSLKTMQDIEEHGLHVAVEITRRADPQSMNFENQPSPATVAGKRIYVNTTLADNEVRLFNSFGLQAIFFVPPRWNGPDTIAANVVHWPFGMMNT